MTNKERDDLIEECAAIADNWLSVFGGQKPEFITAQHWADDAVTDIAENIRKLKAAFEPVDHSDAILAADLKLNGPSKSQ